MFTALKHCVVEIPLIRLFKWKPTESDSNLFTWDTSEGVGEGLNSMSAFYRMLSFGIIVYMACC